MNRIFTILMIIVVVPSTIMAQIEQVSIGQGYSQQAYYNLETGDVELIANDAWDIAFSAFGQQDAGVFINESSTFMAQPQLAFLSSTIDWSTEIVNTEVFVDSLALYNPEKNWKEGAFNTIKEDEFSPFDFGWGQYNPQTNTVEGKSIFVIKQRDGNFIKFHIESLAGGVYSIIYADLDGNNEYSYEINKQDAINGMVHFSFATNDIVEMPLEYDLIFQRYSTPLDAGDGLLIPYTVTGVLLSSTTEAALIDGVDPTNIDILDYVDDLSSNPLEIGHEWKSFDFNLGWVIDEDRTHLIKDKSGKLYQLTFLDFEGSSTGTSTLEKTIVGTVSSIDNELQSYDFQVFPNPTSEYFSINSKTGQSFELEIYDINARLIKTLISTSNEKIFVGDMPQGTYYIRIKKDALRANILPLLIR